MCAPTTIHTLRRILMSALLFLPAFVFPQVVNIENKRFENDTARWTGQVGLRFNVVENTQRSTDLGAKGGMQFKHDIHRAYFVTDFNLNKFESNAFTNRASSTCDTNANGTARSPWKAIPNWNTTGTCASIRAGSPGQVSRRSFAMHRTFALPWEAPCSSSTRWTA